jgi:glucokinase
VSSQCVLAVDVGGTSIKAEILDPSLTGCATASIATPRAGGDATLSAVIDLARRLLSDLPSPTGVTRVGLAVPGLVDVDRGVGVLAANLAWRDLPVTAPVSAALGLPVTMVHDVTAAGVAEWRCGAGRGVDDLAVVVIGTGIAATLVTGGVLVRGGTGQAGELGHVVVRPGGPPCACGQRGCLEAISSARAIADAYAVRSGRLVDGAIEVSTRLGFDPVAEEVWQDAVDALADALLIVCALLAPSRIVLGGGLAGAGEALLGPVRSRLERTAGLEAAPPVVAAQLGARAGVIGAALAALDAANAAA